jgi:hypothetical protein
VEQEEQDQSVDSAFDQADVVADYVTGVSERRGAWTERLDKRITTDYS